MRSLLMVFVNICLLRRGPELVPTQPWFVATVATANFLASFVVSNHVGAVLAPMALATSLLVTMATLSVVVWGALYLRGFDRRFPATITAMFGCDLLFTALVGLLMLVIGGVASPLGTPLLALVGIWSIAVNGFILHRAMQVSVTIGILLAFVTALFGFMLSSVAVGPTTTPT
jgi:hypothetical protein